MNSQEEIDHGLSQGADDFLTKPFSMDVLMGRVENLLATNTEGRLVDQLTTLPAGASMKLRIQSMINRRKTFSAAYIELLGISDFGELVGNDGRARAVRHFARLLHQCGTKIDEKHFRIGHMGGGHFVALLEPERAETFCKTACASWAKYTSKLFEDHKQDKLLEQGRRKTAKSAPMLDALFCATQHNAGNSMSSRTLFEVLSRLRSKSIEAKNAGGIFIDRRS